MTNKLEHHAKPEEHIEYRVKVSIQHDLANGLKAGDEFTPRDQPTTNAQELYSLIDWWKSHGHKAQIESRSARISYSAWEEA